MILNHFGTTWQLHNQWTRVHNILQKIHEFLLSRKQKLNSTHILNPIFLNATFEAFEKGSQTKLKHTPSTGFVALVLLSKVCSEIHAFGFIGPGHVGWHDTKSEHNLLNIWTKDPYAKVKLFLHPPLLED